MRGRYPDDVAGALGDALGPADAVARGDLERIAQPIDFLGVNYYFPHRVAADPSRRPLALRHADPEPPLTSMGWEQDPSGLQDVLARLRDDYGNPPVYITENGAAFPDEEARNGVVEDPLRVAYLRGHLAAVRRAIADGADVRRYYAWSFLDNFEWEHGYGQRFGIVHVDYATQRRTVKRSGLWYRDHIAASLGRAA
jgi:beta-glucosidase